jgi:hypothetical protein
VAINVDALPPVSAEEGREAAAEVAELVGQYCGGTATVHRLDAGKASVEVK